MSEHPSPSSFSSGLRIAVVGVGGIGSTYAFQLARIGGHDVTVVARPGSPRLHQLERDRAIINNKAERVSVHVADKLDETIPYDLVLVTLQTQQIDSVLPYLARSAAKWIQFMGNTFNPERLQAAVGVHRSSLGMPFVQATIDPEGVLHAKIGVGGQRSKMNSEELVKLFRGSDLPAVFEPKMALWLRCHAPLGAAFEGISAAAVRRGGGASWAEAMLTADGLQESLTLVQRLGYTLYPTGKARLQVSPTWVVAVMLWSVSRIRSFRELLAIGVNECCALVEGFMAAAPQADPPVSIEKIRAIALTAKDATFASQRPQ